MKKRDFESYQKRFRDHAKISRDQRFSSYHSPPLLSNNYYESFTHVKLCNLML